MPARHVAKTESAPKTSGAARPSIDRAALAFVALVALLAFILFPKNPAGRAVVVDGQKLAIETVDSQSAKMHGLSNRKSMPRTEGMLFAYDTPGGYCLWMKDMHFSLDMLWLDENKRVVTIHQNVEPETYPETFCPDRPARYMLEVNAGVVRAANVRVGDRLRIP